MIIKKLQFYLLIPTGLHTFIKKRDMSKVFAGFHIVFATRNRKRTLPGDEQKRVLYAYIHSIIESRNSKTFRINGVRDHIHIAIDLNPSVALSDLVRDIKRSTSEFLKPSNGFPLFEGWGKGYYAASFSRENRDGVIQYIKDQEEHHLRNIFEAEMEWLSQKAGLSFHPDDMK